MRSRDTGSISAAGRLLGMSYRRTWLLVDAMNRCWAEPLVATSTGGTQGRRRARDAARREVRAEYAALVARIEAAAEPAALLASLRDEPLPPAHPRPSH